MSTESQSIALPIVDDSFFIDGTCFEKYTTCRRSFEYYGIRKRELGERRSPLEAGAIFHSLMEHRRRKQHLVDLKVIEAEQEQLAHLYYAGWKLAGSPEMMTILGGPETTTDYAKMCERFPGFTPALDDFRTETHMIDAIRAYNKTYSVEPFDLVFDDKGAPMVELSFAFPLVTLNAPLLHPRPITFYWMGKIDLPTKWADGYWNSDIKTATRDNGFEEFANDQAQIGYLWALQKILNAPVEGFMIDKVLWRAPTKTGKGIEFKRHKERIAADRIAEWEHNTIAICEDIVNDAVRGYFPMESKWCMGKYGTCPYLMVCKLSPAGRDVLLASTFYKDVTWSPLRKPGHAA